MSLIGHRRAPLVILCLFIVLGVFYSIVDPVFEASDELNHYPFVAHLARGGGLPVQRAGEDTLWKQEGSQPPLYYVLAAILTAPINTDDLPQVMYLNPHARVGIPLATDNKNMIVHTGRERFPWRGTVLAVHLIRLFSLALGAGTILCTYRLARRLLPAHPAMATLAMAVNAFLPMFLFISASVNNDNLVIFLASLALLLMARLAQGEAGRRRLILLGVVIGLACLSKVSALGLLPLAALALAVPRLRAVRTPAAAGSAEATSGGAVPSFTKALWGWLADGAAVFIPVVVIAGWWYLRNWQLYGDPTGTAAMLDVAGRRPVRPTLRQLWGEFEGFRINFWGLFGGVNVPLKPLWIYRVLDVLTLAACAGLAAWAIRLSRGERARVGPVLLLGGAWIVVEGVALVRWTMSTFASQGRLIFPALSAICVFLAVGWVAWLPRRGQMMAAWCLAAGFFVLAASAPLTAIRPAYALPPILTAAPASAHPYNATYGGTVRLLAYQIGAERVRPGESLPVTLYWQALAPMHEDFSIYLQLFGMDGQRLAQTDTYPGGGAYPTSLWSPGQVIRDDYRVPVAPDARGPVAAQLQVGLYRLKTGERLPAVDAQGQVVGQPVLARVKVATPTAPQAARQAVNANLDNRVRLAGFDLPEAQVRAGAEAPLTLYWQVLAAPGADYQVFVHLLDGAGAIAGRGDGPPLGDQYPTSFWEAGENLADTHRLSIPSTTAPGTYQIEVGLYRLDTGARLPLLDGAGRQIGDRILLTSLRVLPAS